MARSAEAWSGDVHERAEGPVSSNVAMVTHTAEIVAAYVGARPLTPDALPGFAQDVPRALRRLDPQSAPLLVSVSR